MKRFYLLLISLLALGATNANAYVEILNGTLENGKTYDSTNQSGIESGKVIVSDDGMHVTFDNLVYVNKNMGINYIIGLGGGDVTLTLVGENIIKTPGYEGIYLFNDGPNVISEFTITGGSLYIESSEAGICYNSNSIINLVDTRYESKSCSTSSFDQAWYKFIECDNILTSSGWNNVGHLNIKNSTVIGHQPTNMYGIKINKLELEDCLMVEPFGTVKVALDPEYEYGFHIYCAGEIAEDFVIKPYTEVTLNNGPEGDLNHDGQVNTGDVSRLYQLILQ